MSQLTTGIIEGFLRFDQAGTPKMLPFQDALETAAINYQTTNQIVETFSNNGIKGAAAACPFSEALTVTLGSSNLVWTFLQAALATLANDATEPEDTAETVVLSDVDGTPASTATLTQTPLTGTGNEVLVTDEDGVEYTVTVSGQTVTFDADYTGQRVTIAYRVAASGTNNEIQLGAGQKILETGIYGRFFGCPDTFIIAVPKAVIASNVDIAVGDSPASAQLTATALRDPRGNFAYIKRVTS